MEESVFAGLVASGVVKDETLVWQTGMENWQPYSAVRQPMASATQEPGTVECSSCGNFFPESDVIRIGGRTICAICKPRVVQEMVEGTGPDGALVDPAKLLTDLRARGGYRMPLVRYLPAPGMSCAATSGPASASRCSLTF